MTGPYRCTTLESGTPIGPCQAITSYILCRSMKITLRPIDGVGLKMRLHDFDSVRERCTQVFRKPGVSARVHTNLGVYG